MDEKRNEIILFENQGVKLEVNLKDETVWLTQEQMAKLFGKAKSTINEHIKNVYKEGELVENETMTKFMGEGSGLKGILLAMFIGSAAAGPLYGAFPVAAVFMKKGVSLKNILIFIGAWSTTKIPLILFEITSLGPKFALTRFLINIPGIIIIATILSKIVPQDEINEIYKNAQESI